MTQRILRGAMDRACVLFSDLIEGRWEKVDGEFDATLRGQVLTDRFVPVWAKVVDSAGSFERIDAPSARQFGGYTLVDVPLAFAAGGAIGEVVFDRADKVAGLALEFPYPRPRQLEQRRRQWEQGTRQGGFIVRNPEIDGLMRHSALARAQPAYACRQRPLPMRPNPAVYANYDPIVLAHARALMTSDPAGASVFIQADFREPGKILAAPELRQTLDLGKPV